MMQVLKLTGACLAFLTSFSLAISNQAQKPTKPTTLPEDNKITQLRQVLESQDKKIETLIVQSDSSAAKIQEITTTSASTETVMSDTYKRAINIIVTLRNIQPAEVPVHFTPLRPVIYTIPEPKPVDFPAVEPPVVDSRGFFKKLFHWR